MSSDRPRLLPDRIGIALSSLCALHCLAAPLLFALLPSLTLALHSFNAPGRSFAMFLLHVQRFDRPIVFAALALAFASSAYGWRRHRCISPFAWTALAAITLGVGLVQSHPASISHAAAFVMGGLCLMMAHVANLRLLQGHRRPFAGKQV